MFADFITSLYLGLVMCISAIPALPTYQYLKETIIQDAPEWE